MHDLIASVVERYPDLAGCREDIERAYTLLEGTFRNGGKLLACGNGGSAADCEHIVGELMKGFASRRPLDHEWRASLMNAAPDDGEYLANHLQGALPAISLVGQSALVTAIGNDVAGDMAFAQQVHGYGRAGDALLCISTSGNSRNVVLAAQVARAAGLAVIGLTGADGGRLARWCDACVRVPYTEVFQVQERHLPVYHAICLMLERNFFPEPHGSDRG